MADIQKLAERLQEIAGRAAQARVPDGAELIGTVTAVCLVGRRNKRCRIYVDGELLTECNPDIVHEFGLGRGTPPTAPLLEAVEAAEARLQMRRHALAFVAFKPRTEEQARKRLREHGYNDALVEAGIAFLYEFDYLDDRRYARLYAEEQLRLGKKGLRRIKHDLQQRGVQPDLCDEVLRDLNTAADESERAIEAARRRLPQLKHKEPQKQRSSLHAWLLRRGFGFDDVRLALNDVFAEEE